jgi:hypothetical protein
MRLGQNPFLSVTENSFLNALKLSTFHDNALSANKSDPVFAALYLAYHILHLAFVADYNAWVLQGGKQHGKTLTLQQLLQLLESTKIQQWDVSVQNIYPKSTNEYKIIFPRHHKPFQSGTQIEIISALNVLSGALASDTKLAAIKTDVDNFIILLEGGHSTQKESQDTTKTMVSTLEASRIAICIAMYANLGALIQKFAATPEKVLQFFDMTILERTSQSFFTGHLKASEVYTIVKHTFGADDKIYLSNEGTTTLKFYLSNTKDALPSTLSVTLASGNQTILANTLGALTDTYLTVQNTSTTQMGSFEIEIL